MNRRMKVSPWVQIFLHIAFGIFYTAQLAGLIADDHTGKWLTVVVGQVQSGLAIYGIFTPSPNGKLVISSKRDAEKR